MDTTQEMQIVGWREVAALPELGISRIKAKIDTGARSSSLHAHDIHRFKREDQDWVAFSVWPLQRSEDKEVRCECRVLDVRSVRSSSGEASERIVISTNLYLFDQQWPIELTLADRTEMGFRMLVGREALRGKFLVDSSKAFLAGPPPRRKRRHR